MLIPVGILPVACLNVSYERCSFCENMILNNQPKSSVKAKKRLLEIVDSLAPVRILTTKLQESTLTSCPAIDNWQPTCYRWEKMLFSNSETSERMNARQNLLHTRPVLVAIYLNSEYQVFLSEEIISQNWAWSSVKVFSCYMRHRLVYYKSAQQQCL